MNPVVIDLYHGDILSDIVALKNAGIKGIIHKATQGTFFQDDKYLARKQWALENDILWGAYHWGTNEDVETQVQYFLDFAQPDKKTLLALDFEEDKEQQMSLEQARYFLKLVAAATGRKPVLYSGSLIKELLTEPDPFFNSHRLWMPQYGPKAVLPPGWDTYWLWQYTGDGVGPQPHEIDGVDTKGIDLNVFGGVDLVQEWAG